MQPTDLRFGYGQSGWKTPVFLLLGSGLAAFAMWRAWTNDAGVLINRVIELGEQGATIFWWTIAAILVFGVLFAAWSYFRNLGQDRAIILGHDALLAPRAAWSQEQRRIPYARIDRIRVMSVQGQSFLHVFDPGRKTIIPAQMLARASSGGCATNSTRASGRRCGGGRARRSGER